MGLGSARKQVTWVNIWQDPDAAAFVMSLRDGFQTVPTAVTGDGDLLDANADLIKERIGAG